MLFDYSLLKINPKIFVILILGLSVIREIQRGYFSKFIDYIKNLDWQPHLQMLVSFSISTGLLMFADAWLMRWVQSWKAPWFLTAVRLGGIMGYGVHPWLILALAYAISFGLKKIQVNRLIFRCMMSAAIASLLTQLCKVLTLRARPLVEQGPFSFFNWHGFTTDGGRFLSLPSGDVAVVAGIFCYLFYLTKNRALGFLTMLFPLLTAFSRVVLNKHWPSDTFLAVGLAFIAGWIIHGYDEFLHEKRIAL